MLDLQRTHGNRQLARALSLARRENEVGDVGAEVERAIDRARGSGATLDRTVRLQMERAFGADFSGVRVHTDACSQRLSQELGALAFATGKDIFFGSGTYSPSSSRGRELLAHELTHVVQHGGAGPRSGSSQPARIWRLCPTCEEEARKRKLQTKLTVTQPQDPEELEAEYMAKLVTQMLNSEPPEESYAQIVSGTPGSAAIALMTQGLEFARAKRNLAATDLLERSLRIANAHPEHFEAFRPVAGAAGCANRTVGVGLDRARIGRVREHGAAVGRGTLGGTLERMSIARQAGGQRTTLQCINANLANAGIPWALISILGGVCGIMGAVAGMAGGPAAPATAPSGAVIAAAVCIAGVTGLSVGTILGVIIRCAQDPSVEWVFARAETGGSGEAARA